MAHHFYCLWIILSTSCLVICVEVSICYGECNNNKNTDMDLNDVCYGSSLPGVACRPRYWLLVPNRFMSKPKVKESHTVKIHESYWFDSESPSVDTARPCPDSYYIEGENNRYSCHKCTQCSPGEEPIPGPVSQCNGWGTRDTVCRRCPPGYYKADFGNNPCTPLNCDLISKGDCNSAVLNIDVLHSILQHEWAERISLSKSMLDELANIYAHPWTYAFLMRMVFNTSLEKNDSSDIEYITNSQIPKPVFGGEKGISPKEEIVINFPNILSGFSKAFLISSELLTMSLVSIITSVASLTLFTRHVSSLKYESQCNRYTNCGDMKTPEMTTRNKKKTKPQNKSQKVRNQANIKKPRDNPTQNNGNNSDHNGKGKHDNSQGGHCLSTEVKTQDQNDDAESSDFNGQTDHEILTRSMNDFVFINEESITNRNGENMIINEPATDWNKKQEDDTYEDINEPAIVNGNSNVKPLTREEMIASIPIVDVNKPPPNGRNGENGNAAIKIFSDRITEEFSRKLDGVIASLEAKAYHPKQWYLTPKLQEVLLFRHNIQCLFYFRSYNKKCKVTISDIENFLMTYHEKSFQTTIKSY